LAEQRGKSSPPHRSENLAAGEKGFRGFGWKGEDLDKPPREDLGAAKLASQSTVPGSKIYQKDFLATGRMPFIFKPDTLQLTCIVATILNIGAQLKMSGNSV
jgi:hypothetical protein